MFFETVICCTHGLTKGVSFAIFFRSIIFLILSCSRVIKGSVPFIALGWMVSGTRHVAMDVDRTGRALLQWLDGSRDRTALIEIMQTHLAESAIVLPHDPLAARIDQQLWQWVRQGLCVADD